jgi:serine/threonine protein kinase
LVIGQLLGNRYRLVEKIGEGGMALVYKAEDSLLRRLVAVKVLRSQYANDLEFVERFRREAQAAASLSHANVVNIYDVGQENGIDYIVMEYVAGENLKDLIRREAPFTVRRALSIALQICEALNHAHQHNIVHRDIKPHNILITAEGRVKVTDFGIARAVSASGLTQTGVVLGSVQYFSPEQAQGGVVGTQSDLYSLGCVMYEMLTGKVPFSGESPIAIALKQIQETPAPVDKVRPGLPANVSRIVAKALAKELTQRYPTAYAMIRELQVAMAGEPTMDGEDLPTQTLPVLPVGKGRSKSSWRPWIISASVLLAVLCLVGVGLSIFLRPKPSVRVPDMIGMSKAQAEAAAHEQHLTIFVAREVYNSEMEAGRVISQSPKAGTETKAGRTIRIVLSRGSEMVKVPDLTGKTQVEAELSLESRRLGLGNVYMEPSNVTPKGNVARQTPEPGSSVKKGSYVDIYISLGPNVDTVKVPNFIGRQMTEVQAELAGLGLVFTASTSETSAFPAGQILDQQPAPGSLVPVGTGMTFVVSSGIAG